MASFFLTRVVQILNTRTPVYLSFLKKRLTKRNLARNLHCSFQLPLDKLPRVVCETENKIMLKSLPLLTILEITLCMAINYSKEHYPLAKKN